MKQFNIDLQQELVQRSTAELELLLDEELKKQTPDDDVVLTLLHILKEREPNLPLQLSSREEDAVKRYQQKRNNAKRRKPIARRLLSIAASVILILTMLFTIAPQEAEAETFWEILQRITHTVLEYFNPRDSFDEAESNYVFETANPGLQQVYEEVIKLGITEPVVPMWLPDGYHLTSISNKDTPMLNGIYSAFSNGVSEIVFRIDLYSGEPARQYYKDDTHYESHEWDGTTYHIARNKNLWVVIWKKEKIECLLTVDCHEDTLRRMLSSIYVTEDE